jgi:oligopeptide transport system substrate-binding protein
MIRRRTVVAGAPLAVAAIGATPAWSQQAVVFNRGNGAEPGTLDPHRATGVPESHIFRDLFETLTTNAANGRTMPGAAERWSGTEDGLTYTFILRADGKWSNGEPVTAEDFVFSFRRLVDPATASRFAWLAKPLVNAEEITAGRMPPDQLGVVAKDARTLEIRLKSPTPYFIDALKHNSFAPVHRASVQQHGAQFTRPQNLVCNGAYRLTEWVPQGHIRLERNPNFHAAAEVRIPTVMVYPTTDRAQEITRFRAGELDMTYEVPVDQVEALQRTLPQAFSNHIYFGTYYLTLQTQRAPYTDVRVRRALALAINREAIVEQIMRAGEVPAYSFVPPGANDGTIPYAAQAHDFKAWPAARRTEEARRLIREAGFTDRNPLRLEFLFNTNDTHRRLGVALGAMWQEAFGERVVQTSLRNVEWQVYLDATARGEFTMARAGWIGATYSDASYFLEKFKGDAGEANSSRWVNAEYDGFLDQALREPNPQRRQNLLEQAEAVMLREFPIIPIFHYSRPRLISPRLTGWERNPQDVAPSRFMSFRS